MPTWPDKEEALLRRFVESLKLRASGAPYRSVLRGFQRFVCRRTPGPAKRSDDSRVASATIKGVTDSYGP